MFKKSISVLSALIFSVSMVNGFTLFVKAAQYKDFIYSVVNNEIFIGGYTGSDISVTIPSEIEGLPVTGIRRHAFYLKDIENFIIPDSVIYIDRMAFLGTKWYNNILDGPVYAGKVFCEYKGEIPDNKTIKIKDGTKAISGEAFIFSTDFEKIIIPDSVVYIGNYAFRSSKKLISVDLPDKLEYIGKDAFSDCSSLKSMEIPDSVRYIGEGAFFWCSSLSYVNIPDGIDIIEEAVFGECESLESIKIPDSVKSIGLSAFSGCRSLESVTIPDEITYIGESAFRGCSKLTVMKIPEKVTYIGENAFAGCISMAVFVVDSKNENYSSEDNVLFNKNKTKLMYFSSGKEGEYIVPDSVILIDISAFASAKKITSVTIPETVSYVVSAVFFGCVSLRYALFLGDAPIVFGEYVFERTHSDFIIYYTDEKDGWSEPEWNGYRSKLLTGNISTNEPEDTSSPEPTKTPVETITATIFLTETLTPQITVTPNETLTPQVTATSNETLTPQVTIAPNETLTPKAVMTEKLSDSRGKTNAEKPKIKKQPKGRTVKKKATLILKILATVKKGKLSYQWYRNKKNRNKRGIKIKKANKASYRIPAKKKCTVYYYCIIKNVDNTATGKKSASVTTSVVKVIVK